MIGGVNKKDILGSEFIQSYDHRAGEWQLLPKPSYGYSGAACCALNGKIYVSGGLNNDLKAEVYQPIAGKWEKMKPMNRKLESHRMVSYANMVYAMGGYIRTNNKCSKNLSVDVYDPASDSWVSSTVLAEAFKRIDATPTCIAEAIVFKSVNK